MLFNRLTGIEECNRLALSRIESLELTHARIHLFKPISHGGAGGGESVEDAGAAGVDGFEVESGADVGGKAAAGAGEDDEALPAGAIGEFIGEREEGFGAGQVVLRKAGQGGGAG